MANPKRVIETWYRCDYGHEWQGHLCDKCLSPICPICDQVDGSQEIGFVGAILLVVKGAI